MSNDNDEMNIKIQNNGANGVSNTKGSSKSLAEYLNHEDPERLAEGKDLIPFRDCEGHEASTQEVIETIDSNTKGLTHSADKFYHLVISPSAQEVQALGEDEKTIYQNAISLMRSILNAYAGNFHREGLTDCSNLVGFWKAHYTRGKDDDGQFHIHVIMSRKSKSIRGKALKLSPLTNHKDTEDGPVKGGFDRKLFAKKCEAIFDQLFHYERSVAETFDYRNAMAHGTSEERAKQAMLLAEEKADSMKDSIAAGVDRLRKKVKNKNEVAEIAELINTDSPVETISEEDSLVLALEWAEFSQSIVQLFSSCKNRLELDLTLGELGCTCEEVLSADGVEEIMFNKGGKKISSQELFEEKEHQGLLSNWQAITSQKPAYKTREQREEKRIQEHEEKRSLGGPSLGL